MKKNLIKQAVKRGNLPSKSVLASPPQNIKSNDIQKVLEHVSSPFRWELLEVPEMLPETPLNKKHAHIKQKST